MKLKTLMNADVLKENPKNRVELEHITGIVPNAEYFVEHSIYFADSLKVFSDAEKTNYLVEGTDYDFAEMDTIASEQSNSECYRAIVFLTEIPEAFISYHSYGDLVSAETLNDIVNEVNTSIDNNLSLGNEIEKLKNDFDVHTKSKKEHGATDTAIPGTMALRTATGTIKVAEPIDADDAVTKNFQEVKIQESENKTSENLNATRKEIITDIEKIEDKVKAKTPAVEVEDFYPDGKSADDVEALPPNEKATLIAEAKKELEKKVSETKAYLNVIRNATGSITIPTATADTDAVNKLDLKNLENDLQDSLKDVKNTVGTLTNIIQNQLTVIDRNIENIKKQIKEIDPSAGYTDEYKFDGTVFETNKTWNGKKVYRVGYQLKGKGIDLNEYTNIPNEKQIVNVDGFYLRSDGIYVKINTPNILLGKGSKQGNKTYFYYIKNTEYNNDIYLLFEFV